MNSSTRSKIRNYSILIGGIGFILITIMAERYKKITFESFKNGIGFEYLSEKNSAKISTNIVADETTGKLSLGSAMSAIAMPAPVSTMPTQNNAVVLSDRFLVRGYDDAGAVTKIYKSTDGTSLTLVKTLSAGFAASGGMIGAGNLAVIFSADVPSSFAYSLDSGQTWTESTQSVFDQYRASNLLIGEYIYFVAHITGGNYGIVRTKDGTIFEIVYQSPSAWLIPTYLVEDNGALFFTTGSIVYKLENNEAKIIQKLPKDADIQLYANGNLYIFSLKIHATAQTTRIKLYQFDGSRFNITRDFTFPARLQSQGPGWRDLNNAYILCGLGTGGYAGFTDNVTFRIDQDGAIHFMNAFDFNNEEVWEIFTFNSVLYYIDGGSISPGLLYGANYALLGSVETPIISDGEMIPKQVILRHKPLVTGTSAKVYIKKDLAAAWTLLLTSNTVGAVKKEYTFANGYGISDFFEFKIELITTDNSVSPDILSLDFLYVPVGLETK